ncbi:sushi, von Willebrand factor type A, EGF and pentraxin domain-containing protein 1-like [Sycon ciliatum]|uniref:sushi, von Willebrand factor type A, EGF and pentraxin domain-containing protein 1-like n=1 Tax=Sycon ciliatum TaxID=27933 RepID=UPI0031F65C0E
MKPSADKANTAREIIHLEGKNYRNEIEIVRQSPAISFTIHDSVFVTATKPKQVKISLRDCVLRLRLAVTRVRFYGDQIQDVLPQVNKTNPLFTHLQGDMPVVSFYLPVVKPGYSRQLVGIGHNGSVNVSKEFKNSQVGDSDYVFLNPGYDIYGFQYVRDSDGRRSPVGAKFSLEVKELNPAFTDHTGTLVSFHLPAVKPGYTRQLVEIGQPGAVDVSMRWNSEGPDDTSDYVKQTPGYHVYGFQYVHVSTGWRSPIGAKFSVGTPPDATVAQQTPVPTPEGKCGVVPTIDLGEYRVVDAGVGNVATYHCSPGYHMIGSGLVICQENGQWSEAPSCYSYCQPLRIPNGRIEEIGHNGSSLPLAEVEPICEPGFDSVGKATCSGERVGWEYETPLCDTWKNARFLSARDSPDSRFPANTVNYAFKRVPAHICQQSTIP